MKCTCVVKIFREVIYDTEFCTKVLCPRLKSNFEQTNEVF